MLGSGLLLSSDMVEARWPAKLSFSGLINGRRLVLQMVVSLRQVVPIGGRATESMVVKANLVCNWLLASVATIFCGRRMLSCQYELCFLFNKGCIRCGWPGTALFSRIKRGAVVMALFLRLAGEFLWLCHKIASQSPLCRPYNKKTLPHKGSPGGYNRGQASSAVDG